MKLSRVELFPVALPRRREHTWAGNRVAIGTYLIVRLHTDDGLTGVGEAPALPDWGGDYDRYYGETPATAAHLIENLLFPAIEGMDPRNISAIHSRMDVVLKGHPFTKTAIDVACYDLAGKAAGLPVHMLLGGKLRDTVAIAHSFGSNLSPDEAVAEAEKVINEGVTNLKLKVGIDYHRDLELVRRFRELGGTAVTIHADANKGWPDPKTAARCINRLDEYDLDFIEQPCGGIDELREIRRLVSCRVMADESAWSARDVYDLARTQAVDMISIYVTKAGGLHKAQKVAAVCDAVGFPANLNGGLETGVGNAANLHFAASSLPVTMPSVLMVNAPKGQNPTEIANRYYLDDIVTTPFGYREGALVVSDLPGLGIELDDEKISFYRADKK